MKIKRLFLYLFFFVFLCLKCTPVYADNTITINDIKLIEKSGTATVQDLQVEENVIHSLVQFNQLNDFITLKLEVTNNGNVEYLLESINNNIQSDYLTIESDFLGKYIPIHETETINVKIKYNRELLNVDEINLTGVYLALNFTDRASFVNPETSNSLLSSLLKLILFANIILSSMVVFKNSKLKYACLLLLLIPLNVFSREGTTITIGFDQFKIKGRFENYTITIDRGNNSLETITKTYGDTLTLTNPSKTGYNFQYWKDQNNNQITNNTITIKSAMTFTAVYQIINYSISYDLDGGTLSSSNPTTYTVEDEFTLNNPSKQGYTFAGWSVGNSNSYQTSVTIYKGTTGNKSFKANYSASDSTTYTVIHKKMNVNGVYDESEIVTLTGATDSNVSPQPKNITGFITPEVQTKKILADGSTTFVYEYARIQYIFEITDRTNMDSSTTANGTYYYGKTITIKANQVAGYTLTWSDGRNSYNRSFTLENNVSLTPRYDPNTDTPYKVIHKIINVEGNNYTIKDTQNLTGTTGSRVTPLVNTYTGFNSPSPQEVVIKGDGTTEVIYLYSRKRYQLTIEDSNYVQTTTPSGEYPYEKSITLKALDKEGYKFVKWSNNNTNKEITFQMVSNVTICPLYTEDTNTAYKVIHRKMSLTGTYDVFETEILTGTTGSTVTPAVKSYEGFIAPSPQQITIKADGTSEVTYNYVRKQFTLTLLNSNYIESDFTTGQYYYGKTITLRAITRQGYTFTGWSNGETNSTLVFVLTGDTTIGPEYTKNQYVVTFYPMGGEVNPTTVSVNMGSAIGTLPVPTRDHYYFVGWYTDTTWTTRITTGTTATGDYDAYAKWIYPVGEAVITNEDIYLAPGGEETIVISNASDIEESYTFTSNNTSIATVNSSGKITKVTLGDTTITITGTISGQTKTVNVYATRCTITFNTNGGGTIDPATMEVMVGSKVTNLPVPVANGNRSFLGWYTDYNGGGTLVDSNYVFNGDIEIIAKWDYNPVATFVDGTAFNTAMKNHIGVYENGPGYFTRNIQKILKASELPNNFVPSSDNIISTDDSDEPIYYWYDSTNQIIYYYSDANVLYLNEDASKMFVHIYKLNEIEGIEDWNTSKTTDINYMFYNAGLESDSFSIDLSSWDTSNIENMEAAFATIGKAATTWSIGDLSGWNTSSVKNFSYTFYQAGYSATSWTIGTLSGWNTSSATTMTFMFSGAGFSSNSFQLNLTSWNVSNVQDTSFMFNNAGYSATTWSVGTLASWSTGNVTSMIKMFAYSGYSASSFQLNLAGWNVSKVTDLSYMFYFTGYNATTWNIGSLSSWNVSSCLNLEGFFYEAAHSASSFTQNLTSWDTSKVEIMKGVFYYTAKNANTFNVNISGWNTINVVDMGYMFPYAGESATTWTVGDLSNWNTSKVTDMIFMFADTGKNATDWSIGDISRWDVSNVTNMAAMFNIAASKTETFNLGNLSNWNVSKVTTLSYMFCGAGDAATTWYIGDLSGWNTINVTDMARTFSIHALTTDFDIGDLSGWNTAKVTTMAGMFEGCGAYDTSWSVGDLSSWNVSKVTDMSEMFNYAGYRSETFDIGTLSGWNTSLVVNMSEMFAYAGASAPNWGHTVTLDVYADDVGDMFDHSSSANVILNIYLEPTTYTKDYGMFNYAATKTDASIVVNYTSDVTNIDQMIATKSSSSNVTKGSLIS